MVSRRILQNGPWNLAKFAVEKLWALDVSIDNVSVFQFSL